MTPARVASLLVVEDGVVDAFATLLPLVLPRSGVSLLPRRPVVVGDGWWIQLGGLHERMLCDSRGW